MSDPKHDQLRAYVTNLDRPVYALRNLPEEVMAVLFAYYSRSTDSLRDNLRRLLDEGDRALQPRLQEERDEGVEQAKAKARAVHEKWVVGYGHASVAEHAVVHLAIEDISIVATKVLEDNRLASYTEKSTRSVPVDRDSFHLEADVAASPEAEIYTACCRNLLGLYTELMPQVIAQVSRQVPRPEDWTERRHQSVCRAKAFDLLRYLLPAATRTNVGLTVNGRALEHLLTKLYSHPLAELRALAAALRAEAEAIVPTLIKYAAPNDYLGGARERIADLVAEHLPPSPREVPSNSARLLHAPAEPYTELATAILYEAASRPFDAVRQRVAALGESAQAAIVDSYLAGRGPFDAPLRALEHLVYTFEIVLDYGAFRDIQRHRMCTQTTQLLTTAEGYETPPELEALGHAGLPRGPGVAAEAWQAIAAAHGPERAQYVLPLAWRKRLLVTGTCASCTTSSACGRASKAIPAIAASRRSAGANWTACIRGWRSISGGFGRLRVGEGVRCPLPRPDGTATARERVGCASASGASGLAPWRSRCCLALSWEPMPELPEVETVRRGLEAGLLGRAVVAVTAHRTDQLRPAAETVLAGLPGRTFIAARRTGKHLFCDLDDGWTLASHLRMTGQWRIQDAAEPCRPHTHLQLALDDGRELRWRDVRRFGWIHLLPTDQAPRLESLAGMGPDALTLSRRSSSLAYAAAGGRSRPCSSLRIGSPGLATSTPTRSSGRRACTRSKAPIGCRRANSGSSTTRCTRP